MAAALPTLIQDVGPVSLLPPLCPFPPILLPEHPLLDLHETGSSQHFMTLPQTSFCDLAVTGPYLKVSYLLILPLMGKEVGCSHFHPYDKKLEKLKISNF